MSKVGPFDELIAKSDRIIAFCREHGFLKWENPPAPGVDTAPRKEIIAPGDYVAAYGELASALEKSAAGKETSGPNQEVELESRLTEIEELIRKNLTCDEIGKTFVEILTLLESEIREINGIDLFYYEQACGFRDLAGNYSRVLAELCGGKPVLVGNEDPKTVLARLDGSLRIEMGKIAKAYPGLEKPFPDLRAGTPDSSWWYFR